MAEKLVFRLTGLKRLTSRDEAQVPEVACDAIPVFYRQMGNVFNQRQALLRRHLHSHHVSTLLCCRLLHDYFDTVDEHCSMTMLIISGYLGYLDMTALIQTCIK